MGMTLDIAKKMLLAGRGKARSLGILCSIAIVDENGWLVGLHRVDGAPIATVDIARDKAWTAVAFKLPTSDVSRFGDASAPGFGLNAQNWNDRLTTIPGGLPIKGTDQVIGGIGVCGGTPEQDVAVCKVAIAAIHA
jgi:uncharacterized protein GlcG (DUF336 family)